MISSSAIFSDNRIYRYALTRIWDKKLPSIMIIGLNPSTADESENDPTIRRCIGFAKKWGYGKLYVTNLFAYRATYPKNLFEYSEPIGDENDYWISKLLKEVDTVVLAYGNSGKYRNRDKEILNLVQNPYCIKTSKANMPVHPLYMKYTDKAIRYG